jgi:hypothetical protein
MPSARSPHKTEDTLDPVTPSLRPTMIQWLDRPDPPDRPNHGAGSNGSGAKTGLATGLKHPGSLVTVTLQQLYQIGLGFCVWTMWIMIGLGVQIPIAPIANAAPLTCRLYDDHDVCIDRIKRSAKNYWEYRVSLTIDGQKQPEDVLDCRHYQRIDRDGFIDPFKPNDVGRFVCRYFNHRDWR